MSLRIVAMILLGILETFANNVTKVNSDYDLVFPDKSHKAAAVFTDLPIVNNFTEELTSCFWVNQTANSFSTYISYASIEHDNKYTIRQKNQTLKFSVSQEEMNLFIEEFELNRWIHYCFAWRSRDGRVAMYKNGELVALGAGKLKGLVVYQYGTFVLGQDQDKVGGAYNKKEAFHGRLSKLNIWEKYLSPEEVKLSWQDQLEGTVISWSQTPWKLKGKLKKEKTTLAILPPLIEEKENETKCAMAEEVPLEGNNINVSEEALLPVQELELLPLLPINLMGQDMVVDFVMDSGRKHEHGEEGEEEEEEGEEECAEEKESEEEECEEDEEEKDC